MELDCLTCVSEYMQEKQKWELDLSKDKGPAPEYGSSVSKAVTLAPSWLERMVGPGQMVIVAVPLPTCLGHIEIQEKSALEKAIANGKLALG